MPYEMQIFSLYVGGVQYEETFFFGACACYVLMPRSVFQRRGALRARGAVRTAVPEYSFINSDRYVQSGTTGIGYRVAIGDGATEEE